MANASKPGSISYQMVDWANNVTTATPSQAAPIQSSQVFITYNKQLPGHLQLQLSLGKNTPYMILSCEIFRVK